MNEKENRIIVFDVFKGIAMLLIIFVHSGFYSFPGLIGKIGAFGARGTQIFFIISAIFIFKSLSSAKCGTKQFKLNEWYLNKFIRLIPIYFISIIVYFIINGFNTTYWSGSVGINIFTYIFNLLFLHGLVPYFINAININWYIGTLALFILIAPFIFKVINNFQKGIIFFLSSWIVSITLPHIMNAIFVGGGGGMEYRFIYLGSILE